MFDIKLVRDDPAAFDAALAKRGLEPLSSSLLSLDEERRRQIADLQAIQERRNAASKEVGQAKAKGDEERARALIAEVGRLKGALQEGEEKSREIDARMHEAMAQIPNLPVEDVPVGPDESANREVARHGTIRNRANDIKQHFEIGEALGLMDFETAAKLSGARFVVLKGMLARLDRALANFMLDLHTGEFGYTEVQPPLLVRSETMFGTAQLPKFAEDQFRTTDDYWLIPTAEVPLTNLVRESILDEESLPRRYTAWTPCFRAEAGAAGRDTRGMIRQHQFSKVELVSIATPERSGEEHERMLACAEEVLKRLDLPYRVMLLSSGDMGFAAQKTYDIEVWLSGQGAYREISSVSVCGDFQARRMNARYRPAGEKGTRFVHTLNGSGLAIGRTMVAVLENFQEADGSVTIPPALVPYMGGRTRIEGDT